MSLFGPLLVAPNIASYATAFSGSSPTTATTSSIGYIWHSATNTKRVEIYRITASPGGGSGNFYTVRGRRITAVSGTPGGLALTAQQLDRDDPASTLTSTTGDLRLVPATPPTAGSANDIFCEAIGGTNTGQQFILFDVTKSGKPLVLRASQAEGIEFRFVTPTTMTTGAVLSISVLWTEV